MIALTLGLFLVAAFLLVLQRCRASFAANESLARLQDAARHALSVLVPDIEHAGFYGFSHGHAVRLVGSLPAGSQCLRHGFRRVVVRSCAGLGQHLSPRRGRARLRTHRIRGRSSPGDRHADFAPRVVESGRAAGRAAADLFAKPFGRGAPAAVCRWPRARARGSGSCGPRSRGAHLLHRKRLGAAARLARVACESADGVAWRRAVPR